MYVEYEEDSFSVLKQNLKVEKGKNRDLRNILSVIISQYGIDGEISILEKHFKDIKNLDPTITLIRDDRNRSIIIKSIK